MIEENSSISLVFDGACVEVVAGLVEEGRGVLELLSIDVEELIGGVEGVGLWVLWGRRGVLDGEMPLLEQILNLDKKLSGFRCFEAAAQLVPLLHLL